VFFDVQDEQIDDFLERLMRSIEDLTGGPATTPDGENREPEDGREATAAEQYVQDLLEKMLSAPIVLPTPEEEAESQDDEAFQKALQDAIDQLGNTPPSRPRRCSKNTCKGSWARPSSCPRRHRLRRCR
jgi:hypothetical protein